MSVTNIFNLLFGASWRTTLVGLVAALVNLFFQSPHLPDGTLNWAALVESVLMLIAGRLVKDAGVTGGTVAATKEAENRIP